MIGPETKAERATRNYLVKKRYGITVEQYDDLFVAQNGRCGICGVEECASGRRFSVDHCHDTGRIRGLLCLKCNVALGMLRESAEIARRVAAYLDAYSLTEAA